MAVEMIVEKGITYVTPEVTDAGVVHYWEDALLETFDSGNGLAPELRMPPMYGRVHRIVEASTEARDREIDLEDFHGDAFRALEVGVVGIYELAGPVPYGVSPEVHRQLFYEEMINRADRSAKLNIQIPRSQDEYMELAASLDGEEGVTQLLKNPLALLDRLRAHTKLTDDLAEVGIELSEEERTRQRTLEERITQQILYALLHAQNEDFRRRTDLSKELSVIEDLADQLLFGEKIIVEFYTVHDRQDNTVQRMTKPVEKLPSDLPEPPPEYNIKNERKPEPHRLPAYRLTTGGYGNRKDRQDKEATAAVEKAIRVAILEGKPIKPQNTLDKSRMKILVFDETYAHVRDEDNPNVTTVNKLLQKAIFDRFGDRVSIEPKDKLTRNDHTHGKGFSRQRIYVNFLDKPIAFNPKTGAPEKYACIEIILNSFARDLDNTVGPANYGAYVRTRSEEVARDIYGKPKHPVRPNKPKLHTGPILKEAYQPPSSSQVQYIDYQDYDGQIYDALVDVSNPDEQIMIARVLKPSKPQSPFVLFSMKEPALP